MSDVAEHIRRITDEAGLRIMEEVLTIIRDREETSDDAFLKLTDTDVWEMYSTYIAPAVDEVENLIEPYEGPTHG